jgi:hypothetical protein
MTHTLSIYWRASCISSFCHFVVRERESSKQALLMIPTASHAGGVDGKDARRQGEETTVQQSTTTTTRTKLLLRYCCSIVSRRHTAKAQIIGVVVASLK